MKRYPHTITIMTSSFKELDGELQSQKPLKIDIRGRIDHLEIPQVIAGADGDNIEVTLCFYTKIRPISDAVEVMIDEVKHRVVKWIAFQTHSTIYLK